MLRLHWHRGVDVCSQSAVAHMQRTFRLDASSGGRGISSCYVLKVASMFASAVLVVCTYMYTRMYALHNRLLAMQKRTGAV